MQDERKMNGRVSKDRGKKAASTSDAGLMRKVDRHQARGNILAQMGWVLKKEDQDRAREEVLAHKF